MNCHFSDLKLHRGSWLPSRHTHHTYFSQSDDSSCPASFALRKPNSCHRSSSAGIFVCLSFPNLWPHTLVQCDRQPLPFGSYSVLHPTPPYPTSSAPPWDICVLWGKWAGKLGKLQRRLLEPNKGAPTSELYNIYLNLTACSHEEYHSFSSADTCRELMLWMHFSHAFCFGFLGFFFF